MSQGAFWQADESIAMNTAGMNHAIFDINRDLCRESIVDSINRGANDSREAGGNQSGATDNYKDSMFARIATGWSDYTE